MERYDAAIIGAGPEGLTAATTLAGAGLRVVVLERASRPGGRAVTREFHPGFRASPFADELADIPRRLFWRLDLARRGALMAPAPASTLISEIGAHILTAGAQSCAHTARLAREMDGLRTELAARAEMLDPSPARRLSFRRREPERPGWPGDAMARASLAELLAARVPGEDMALHLAAGALSGRAASPFLVGSALHLLAPGEGCSGAVAGGLGALGDALAAAARAAGATIRCSAEVSDIRRRRGRTSGEEIAAGAVISALDVKRTLLTFFAWSDLPAGIVKAAGRYRMSASRARVLFALDAAPEFSFAAARPATRRGPVHVVASMAALARAHDVWRSNALGDALPVTLRVPSFADPRLAPAGKAVMTATLSGVPLQLFDGAWTKEKRARLVALALAAAETVAPGVSARVLACQPIAPPDFEDALGLTHGDFDGGEIGPDQTMGFRPWPEMADARTPIAGLYLGGPSSAPAPFLLCAAGHRAARTLLADRAAGRLA